MQQFVKNIGYLALLLPSLVYPHETYPDANAMVYYHHDDTDFAIPPPQLPSHDEAMMFFVSGAYTLWSPYQQGMSLLLTLTPQGISPPSWVEPRMNYQSGFKVALGVNTFHDGWKVEAEYTWFYNHPKANRSKLDPTVEYFSFWAGNSNEVTQIDSRFTNYFNRIDLTVDRAFYAGNYFAFAPWIGLVGAWEKQTFDQDLLAGPSLFLVNQSQQWWAIGPYAGIDSTYYFIDYCGIFLTGGGSVNLAEHKVLQFAWQTSPDTVLVNTSIRHWNVEPMVDMTIGVRLNSYGMDWGILLEAGWQLQVWFEHNGFAQTPVPLLQNYGNYSMQGLTAALRLNF